MTSAAAAAAAAAVVAGDGEERCGAERQIGTAGSS